MSKSEIYKQAAIDLLFKAAECQAKDLGYTREEALGDIVGCLPYDVDARLFGEYTEDKEKQKNMRKIFSKYVANHLSHWGFKTMKWFNDSDSDHTVEQHIGGKHTPDSIRDEARSELRERLRERGWDEDEINDRIYDLDNDD